MKVCAWQPHPTSPDEAQYSLCWPVAAMLVALSEGREVAAYDMSEDALARADIHRLSGSVAVKENAAFNQVSQCASQRCIFIP